MLLFISPNLNFLHKIMHFFVIPNLFSNFHTFKQTYTKHMEVSTTLIHFNWRLTYTPKKQLVWHFLYRLQFVQHLEAQQLRHK